MSDTSFIAPGFETLRGAPGNRDAASIAETSVAELTTIRRPTRSLPARYVTHAVESDGSGVPLITVLLDLPRPASEHTPARGS